MKFPALLNSCKGNSTSAANGIRFGVLLDSRTMQLKASITKCAHFVYYSALKLWNGNLNFVEEQIPIKQHQIWIE
jgi:hypothetical protein